MADYDADLVGKFVNAPRPAAPRAMHVDKGGLPVALRFSLTAFEVVYNWLSEAEHAAALSDWKEKQDWFRRWESLGMFSDPTCGHIVAKRLSTYVLSKELADKGAARSMRDVATAESNVSRAVGDFRASARRPADTSFACEQVGAATTTLIGCHHMLWRQFHFAEDVYRVLAQHN